MCGIAGIVAEAPAERDRMPAMLEALRHRGPDGEGVYLSLIHI